MGPCWTFFEWTRPSAVLLLGQGPFRLQDRGQSPPTPKLLAMEGRQVLEWWPGLLFFFPIHSVHVLGDATCCFRAYNRERNKKLRFWHKQASCAGRGLLSLALISEGRELEERVQSAGIFRSTGASPRVPARGDTERPAVVGLSCGEA